MLNIDEIIDYIEDLESKVREEFVEEQIIALDPDDVMFRVYANEWN